MSARRVKGDTIAIWVTMLVLVLLLLYPLIWLGIGSLQGTNGLTLAHYLQTFTGQYLKDLWTTIYVGVVVTVLAVTIGTFLAWSVARVDMPGRGIVRVLSVVSFLTPPHLMAIAFIMLMGPRVGVINVLLAKLFGTELGPFNIFSMAGMIFVLTLTAFPVVYLQVANALENVDPDLELASRIAGVGRIRSALRVTLPLVAPAVTAGATLVFAQTISLFGVPAMIGFPAKVFMISTRIYSMFSPPQNLELASALSFVLVAFTVLAIWLQRAFLARRQFITIGGKGARLSPASVGGWKWLFFGFSWLVLLLSAILPIGILLVSSFFPTFSIIDLDLKKLTVGNYAYILSSSRAVRNSLVNSTLLALGAATLAAIVGTMVSYLDVRSTSRFKKWMDYLAMIPLGVPGIVIAVGMIMAWYRPPFALAGTLTIIMLAYLFHFLPYPVRTMNAAFRQLDPSLEDSALITGSPWARNFRRITLPLVKGGLLSSWILVFVPSLRELSASVILYSAGTETMSVVMFQLYNYGVIGRVTALAILQLALILGFYFAVQKVLGNRLSEL